MRTYLSPTPQNLKFWATIKVTSRGQLGAATLVGAPGDTAGAAMKTDGPFGSYEVSVKKFRSIGGRKSSTQQPAHRVLLLTRSALMEVLGRSRSFRCDSFYELDNMGMAVTRATSVLAPPSPIALTRWAPPPHSRP